MAMELPEGKNVGFAKGMKDIGLPLLGLLETLGTAIASKGQFVSPGTSAFQQQQILQQAEDKQRQFALQQEQAKSQALQRKIQEGQLGLQERKQSLLEQQMERKKALEKALGMATTEEEKNALLEQYEQQEAIKGNKDGYC